MTHEQSTTQEAPTMSSRKQSPIPFPPAATLPDLSQLPPPGSSLAIDEFLPNGDLIVSARGRQFRLSNLTFTPA